MGRRRDLIGVVEASYDLEASDQAWLQELTDRLHDITGVDYGTIAYHVDIDAQGAQIRSPVQSRQTQHDVVSRIERMARLLDQRRRGEAGLLDRARAKIYDSVVREGTREPVDHMLQSEFRRFGPEWMYNLGTPVSDVFALMCHHVDDNGLTVFLGGLGERRSYRPGSYGGPRSRPAAR